MIDGFFYWLTLVCVVTPALLGLLCRSLYKRRVVLSSAIRALSERELVARVIIVSVGAMVILYGHIICGGDDPFLLMILAPIPIYICTARLFYLCFKAQILTYSKPLLVRGFALVMFIVAWLCNVYTDNVFLQYTRTLPSDLPAAKAGVQIIVTALVWVTLLSIPAATLYCVVGILQDVLSSDRPPRKALLCLNPPTHYALPRQPRAVMRILFLGLVITGVTPLNQVIYTSRSPAFEPFVHNLIVYASFHLKDSQCTNNQPEGSYFAPLGYERLAIAIPDEEKGYLFKTLKCPNGDAAKSPEKKPQISVPLELDQQAL